MKPCDPAFDRAPPGATRFQVRKVIFFGACAIAGAPSAEAAESGCGRFEKLPALHVHPPVVLPFVLAVHMSRRRPVARSKKCMLAGSAASAHRLAGAAHEARRQAGDDGRAADVERHQRVGAQRLDHARRARAAARRAPAACHTRCSGRTPSSRSFGRGRPAAGARPAAPSCAPAAGSSAARR